MLQKGRYGNLQSLQANVDAAYSPDGLDVPIIFFATSGMDFQAIARTKGDTLEIEKIQLDQARVSPRREALRSGGNQIGTERRAVRSGGAPPEERALPTTNYAYGYVSIPFVWKNLGPIAPLFLPLAKCPRHFSLGISI